MLAEWEKKFKTKTQRELGERLGIEPPQMTNYKKGREPSFQTLWKIAEHLGIDFMGFPTARSPCVKEEIGKRATESQGEKGVAGGESA